MFCGDSCIDLRGGYVLVAKQGLYKDCVSAVFKQVRGERVSERVRRSVMEPCFGCVLID